MSRSGEMVWPRDFAASSGVLKAISPPLSLAGPDLKPDGVHQPVDRGQGEPPLALHEPAQRRLGDPGPHGDGVTGHPAFADRSPQTLREQLAHSGIIRFYLP